MTLGGSESTQTAAPIAVKGVRLAPLVTLVALFAVCDLVIATVINARSDEAGGTVVGILFAQIVLLATWTALGPTRAPRRVAFGAIAAIFVGFTLVACIRNSGLPENRILWFCGLLSQWFVIQIPFWTLRLAYGWRLGWPNESRDEVDQEQLQFSIAQLLIWTTLVAVILGVARAILPGGPQRSLSSVSQVTVFGSILTFNCLLTWPLIWIFLSRRLGLFSGAAVVLCCIVLTLVEAMTLRHLTGGADSEFFAILNTLLVVTSGIALLMLRFSGFRLVRQPPG